MDKTVSVIIPIYNVEDYLPECMESVLSQTYQNLEIILVDDGSTERSGEIADSFAKRDNRIRVIHKENGGVSSARNAGIEAAQGEYIYFVDPDDYVMPDAIEKMAREIEKENAEICFAGYKRQWIRDGKSVKEDKKTLAIDVDLQSNSMLRNLTLLYRNTLLHVVWNKLFRTKIIKENRLFFPEMKRYEDSNFIYSYLKYVNSMSCIKDAIYCYRIYLNKRKTASSAFVKNEFSKCIFPIYGGGTELIEKHSGNCKEEDTGEFRACLEAYLFQGLCGHMLIQLPISEMGYIEKHRYIKNEISRFLSMGLLPKVGWFNNKKEVMMYRVMKLRLWDVWIILGDYYHLKQEK